MKSLSHSAWNRYLVCGESYNLHYNKRLRPIMVSSNLTFGSAIDNAINDLLEKDIDPIKTFQEDFTYEKCDNVLFEKKDYQPELFTDEHLDQLKGKDEHYKQWANFRIKGRMLLECFQENIVPKIKKVVAVQKETTSRPGFIDCILELDDDGPILCDVKTARRPYKDDQARLSTQLALYAKDQGIDRIAFLVLVKTIEKDKICSKCGFDGTGRLFKSCNNEINGSRCWGKWDLQMKGVKYQIIVDKVDKILQDNVIESMKGCEKAIKDKIFVKNLNNCGAIYGAPCQYFNYCHKNDDMGLQIEPEKEKK